MFGLKGTSAGYIENLRGAFASFPAIYPGLDELSEIASLLTGLGLSYQIDFSSGRGFEYYTGIIFGFYSAGRRLGGGGRYDELIPLVGGDNICACGFALYIDRLMDLLKTSPPGDTILVRAGEGRLSKAALGLARLLRDEGFIARCDTGDERAAGVRWVVEMRGENIMLTDGMSGKRKRISSESELVSYIKEAVCR